MSCLFFRVLMLGDTAVGKSSLVSQFMTSEYLHAYDTSIGESPLLFANNSNSMKRQPIKRSQLFWAMPISKFDSVYSAAAILFSKSHFGRRFHQYSWNFLSFFHSGVHFTKMNGKIQVIARYKSQLIAIQMTVKQTKIIYSKLCK